MPVCCLLSTVCCPEAALRPFPGFRQELFDKLYDFFHRYFSPSGSIYFQHTPAAAVGTSGGKSEGSSQREIT